jgi:hypothetical protein
LSVQAGKWLCGLSVQAGKWLCGLSVQAGKWLCGAQLVVCFSVEHPREGQIQLLRNAQDHS